MSTLVEFKNFTQQPNKTELKFNNLGYNQFNFQYATTNQVTISTTYSNNSSGSMSVTVHNDVDQFQYDFELDTSLFNTISFDSRNNNKTNDDGEYAFVVDNLIVNDTLVGGFSPTNTFTFNTESPFIMTFDLVVNPDQPVQHSFLKLNASQVVVPEPVNFYFSFILLLIVVGVSKRLKLRRVSK